LQALLPWIGRRSTLRVAAGSSKFGESHLLERGAALAD
jgi:hypothetical protein